MSKAKEKARKIECPISEMNPEAIITIIVLMEIEREPTHGFTLSEIYKQISQYHSGSENDLLQKLNLLKEKFPECFMEGKYWGTPGRY